MVVGGREGEGEGEGEEGGSQQVAMCVALSSLATNSTSIVSLKLGRQSDTQEYTVETKVFYLSCMV